MKKTWTLAALAVAALAGCGGGGGDAPSAGTAEGLWAGSTSSGYISNVLVLETGEFYAVYGKNGIAHGATHGTVTSDSGSFSGSGTDFFFAGGTATPATVSGTVAAKTSIQGTLREGGQAITFSGAYDARYDQPAQLSDIAGAWPFNVISPAGVQQGTVTIAADGGLGGSVSTCRFTGQATPRASGKNVFNASVTFAASGCAFNGQTLSGISVLTVNGAARTLTSAAVTSNGSSGLLASGTK